MVCVVCSSLLVVSVFVGVCCLVFVVRRVLTGVCDVCCL